ncbi:Na+/H+ antiporter subunit E [Micromonospora costi]|uniref:Na+/H+ antiporter subunit E n=1 Tax=Micromonospora costi TaxID=1530042 RepID=A0A3B0ABP2_9ACTN|nr:Na+/H+ antiporter subunit E [Micromonospora costi]RKN57851.1 Na+/H+ antiporter subunit E [Micromonospora costi]
MTAGPGEARAGRVRLGVRRWRDQAVALGWLVLIWNLLWGEFTWGNLLAGLLMGAAVLVFFPLPSVTFAGRLRPAALLVLAGRFVVELVVASAHIARIAVQPGYVPRSAVIAVPLRVPTDLNLALTAELVSLVPGTLVIEADRATGTLYLHVMDVRGPQDLVANRRRVLTVERRLVRAIGSSAELRRVYEPSADRAPGGPADPGGSTDPADPGGPAGPDPVDPTDKENRP